MIRGTLIKVQRKWAGVSYPFKTGARSTDDEIRLVVGSIVVWMGSFLNLKGVECQIIIDPERGCIYMPGLCSTDIGKIL